ncbi:5-deoxy-glucuronate isomerase [Pelagicoccus sp. NFK12]|uniref:5-deoxy-glucuronate isomerase n=1 Tax=Pelagicoccus enzymogenes TaxID=2773457 RepID=A0A927IK23_9BACT|nr:5-deoxy-glucuronate isomerase [Pelagicoccus enzymogenes]MBD5782459.1 5-deoxy-glucuronate isomerase [Pelagicoccus enzymogenes]
MPLKNLSVNCLLKAPARKRFSNGYTPIIEGKPRGATPAKLDSDFGILRLGRKRSKTVTTTGETAWVLLHGELTAVVDDETFTASRASLFDEEPATLHVGAGTTVKLSAGENGAELAEVRSPLKRQLPTRFTIGGDLPSEHRGAGLVQGTCQRCVRTVFDYSTRPESGLVIGEVVNYPGRWSSYPPHHHPQPEIYHYRFTKPQGYGHAELGDDVLKVTEGDTVVIPDGLDHAQVSAPGYGMYYLWIVRHLPRRPYKGFTFTKAHTWLLDPNNQGWAPNLPSNPAQ